MALEVQESTHVCACGGNCGCQDDVQQSNSSTVYLSREEYVARLERYLVELKAEIVSVEEELVSLRQTA